MLPSIGGSKRFWIKHLCRLTLILPVFGAVSLVVNASPTPQTETWQPNGVVRAVEMSQQPGRDTAYIGGDFTYVGPDAANSTAVNLFSPNLPVDAWPAFDGVVYVAIEDGNGGWYVGGDFATVGSESRSGLVRINSDGTVDGWNPGADGTVRALLLSGTDLYVGGDFANTGGQPRARIALLDSDGLATAWNPGADGSVRTLLLSDADVYVGGDFSNIGGQARSRIARIDSAGNATPWDPNVNDTVRTMVLRGSTLFVSGDFSGIDTGPVVRNRLAALDTTVTVAGTYVEAWDPALNVGGTVNTLALNGSTLYVGGDFTDIGGTSRTDLVAINLSNFPLVSLSGGWLPSPPPFIDATSVSHIAARGGTVYVAWQVMASMGRVQVLNTSTAAELWSVDADGLIYALAPTVDTLLMGGVFGSGGGHIRLGLAEINVSIGEADSGTVTDWNPAVINGSVYSIAATSDGLRLYVGGEFTQIDEEMRNNIASLETFNGAVVSWNPSITHPTPATAVVRAMALSPDESVLYVGGVFTEIGVAPDSVPRSNIASLNTTTAVAGGMGNPDLMVGGDVNGGVNALVASSDGGTVFIGGDFTAIGSASRLNVAAIRVATSRASSTWAENNIIDGVVRTVMLNSDDSVLYLGGDFTTIDGDSRGRIAALASATGVVQAANPDVTTGTSVYSLDLSSGDQMLWIGGTFSAVDSTARGNAARINLTEPNLTPWDPAVAIGAGTPSVYAIARAANDSVVVVGGDFTAPREYLALFDTTGPTVSMDVSGGFYNTSQTVILTCVDNASSGGCSIFYTTNGDTPTQASTLYSAPVVINTSTVLRFFALDGDGSVSEVLSATYTIDSTYPTTTAQPDEAALPQISDSDGLIALVCDDVGGSNCDETYYTKDSALNPSNSDGTPSDDARPYTAPLSAQQLLPLDSTTLAELTATEREVFADMTLADILPTAGSAPTLLDLDAFTLGDVPRDAVALNSILLAMVEPYLDFSQIVIADIASNILAAIVDVASIPPGATTLADLIAANIALDLTQISLGSITGNAYSLDEIPASAAPPPAFILVSQVPLIQIRPDGSENRVVLDAVRLELITLEQIPPEFIVGSRLYGNVELKFFSIDRAGNSEADVSGGGQGVQSETYFVDIGVPETSATPNTDDNVFTSAVNVVLSCNDFANLPGFGGAAGGSGCDKTYYTLNGSTPDPDDAGPNRPTKIYSAPITISTATVLRYLSIDNMGNEEPTSFEVYAFTFGSSESGTGASGMAVWLIALLGLLMRRSTSGGSDVSR